jgi:serine/threonine protein kinase
VNLVPDVVLGHGSSGFVIQGTVRNETVAVKFLKWKKTSGLETLRSFLNEIYVMNSIENHDFIVRLVGSSTDHLRYGTVHYFMEYCALGSLEGFLRSNRDTYNDLVTNDEFSCCVRESEVDLQGDILISEGNLFNTKHLVTWSYQITKGMEYLKTKNVRIWPPIIVTKDEIWWFGLNCDDLDNNLPDYTR